MEEVKIGNIKIPAVKGEKGETGSAGKIVEIKIKMLSPLDNPTAENTGSQTEAIIELGIPKGDSIKTVDVNEKGNLIITLESGKRIDAGIVKGVGIRNAKLINGDIIFTLTDGTQIIAGNVYNDEYCENKIREYDENAEVKTQEIQEIINSYNNTLNEKMEIIETTKEEIDTAKEEIIQINEEFRTTKEAIVEETRIKVEENFQPIKNEDIKNMF